MEVIRNKVAESGIVVFNLDDFAPEHSIQEMDIAPFLSGGFVLREKEFRTTLKESDWSHFKDVHVGVFCSTDAIIPTWAFMLIASRLEGIAESVTAGRAIDIRRQLFTKALENHDFSVYQDQIIVIKGCGSGTVPNSAYVEATGYMQEVARKIMYGEPCSSVPIWRRPS